MWLTILFCSMMLQDQPWTIDHILQQESASGFTLSPDARAVLWVKSTYDVEQKAFIQHLFLTDLNSFETVQLTRGTKSCSSPQWSPSGQRVAFVSSREQPGLKKQPEGSQIWMMSMSGGEPWPVTSESKSVVSFAWETEDTLLFLKEESPSRAEQKAKDEKDHGIAIDDMNEKAPVRLFRLDLKEKKVTRLTHNPNNIQDLSVAPSGRHWVTAHQQSLSYEYDEKEKPKFFLHTKGSAEPIELFSDALMIMPNSFHFSPDGQHLYVLVQRSKHPRFFMATITELMEIDLESGEANPINLDWERGIMFGFQPFSNGFVTLLADGVRPKLAVYARSRSNTYSRHMLASDHQGHIQSFTVSDDGKTLVYAHASASSMTQWYVTQLDKRGHSTKTKSITQLNAALKDLPVGKTEVVSWAGAQGDMVEGMLYYPMHYRADQSYPLMVMIHGGPASLDRDTWSDSWAYPHRLYTQRGAFILRPNYHGSAGYGLDFVSSIGNGNYYDLEVPDIEAGVDWLIQQGKVDPQRLGIMGWSNGAILTTAVTVQSGRYRAASAGAGDVDWTSDWANCAFGASFDEYYFGADPITDPDLYRDKSPFYKLGQVTTPTLIFHGDKDSAVPTQQGWMYFRALQQLDQTPARFVLFPGEPHGLTSLAHQKRKVSEELAWFDRYLFESNTQQPRSLKPGSPLHLWHESMSFSQVNGAWGVLHDGILIPEVVRYEGNQVARFEVTQRQYADFDSQYTLRPGDENFPVQGVSYQDAIKYCEWLSEKTQRAFRLPKAGELKPYESAGGNILDTWAGYDLNHDDALELQSYVLAAPRQGGLVKVVGSFDPISKDALIFDLDGNLSEWVSNPSGTGDLAGGCAFLSKDQSRHRFTEVPTAFRGFRVIEEVQP